MPRPANSITLVAGYGVGGLARGLRRLQAPHRAQTPYWCGKPHLGSGARIAARSRSVAELVSRHQDSRMRLGCRRADSIGCSRGYAAESPSVAPCLSPLCRAWVYEPRFLWPIRHAGKTPWSTTRRAEGYSATHAASPPCFSPGVVRGAADNPAFALLVSPAPHSVYSPCRPASRSTCALASQSPSGV